MVSQLGSVTGRRITQSQIPAIQARAQLLPYYKDQERQQANNDRTYQNARDQLDLQQGQLSLNREVADEQAKQADKAARMARMQLGMETGIGIGRLTDDGGATPKADMPKSSVDSVTGGVDSSEVGSNIAAGGSGQVEPGFWGKTGDALTSGNTWASTAFGALAGPELGDAALKDSGIGKRERRMLGGAAAGGAAGYLSSGGDLYSTALSAGLSSLGGLF